MSQTFALVCHATKKQIWVGQGWGEMEVFYSGMPERMLALGAFLRDHENQTLVLLCTDRHDEIAEYEDYADRQEYAR